jgi:hypothetical protein
MILNTAGAQSYARTFSASVVWTGALVTFSLLLPAVPRPRGRGESPTARRAVERPTLLRVGLSPGSVPLSPDLQIFSGGLGLVAGIARAASGFSLQWPA